MTIYTIDLKNSKLEARNLILNSFGWTLEDGYDEGYLLTEILTSKFAFNVNGFEIPPVASEDWIYFGVIFPHSNLFGIFLDNKWEETENPIFYSSSQIRTYLKAWIGEMKMLIKVHRVKDKPGIPDVQIDNSPVVSFLKINYSVPGSIENYLLNFALKDKLSTEVRIMTQSFYSSNERIAKPKGYDLGKIKNIYLITGKNKPILLNINKEEWIYKNDNLEKEIPVVLLFDYEINAELSNYDYFQVSDSICVFYKKEEELNLEFAPNKEYILYGINSEISVGRVCSYDMVVGITIAAYNPDDISTVLDSITAKIKQKSFLSAKPWGQKLGVDIMGGISSSSGSRTLDGLFVKSFKIIIYGLPRGEWTEHN